MIACIYARKSDDDSCGVERQVEIATDFIAAKGWALGSVFSDNDVKGAKLDRPGLNALLAAVDAKAVGAVVMMNGDRLSRATIGATLQLQHHILRAGVEIWFYQTGARVTLKTATDELKGAIDAFGARDFRDQIQAKTTAALRKKAAQGHATGAKTYGYRLVHQGIGAGTHGKDSHTHVTIEVAEAEAAVVRRVFEMAAEGAGDRRISHTLTEERVPAAGRTGWSKDVIRRMLGNQIYVGTVLYGVRTATVDRPPVEVPRPDLRVVDDDLWNRVQARKARTREHYLRDTAGHLLGKPESGLASQYLLSGFLRCHVCGGSLLAVKKRRDKMRYYCGARYSRGASFCANGRGVPLEPLDESVRLSLYRLLTERPDAVADLVAERDRRLRAEQATVGDRRAEALREAAGLEKEIANLIRVAAAGAASDDVTAAINERRAKVEALRATPAPAPVFDRAEFFRRFAGGARIATLLESSYPSQVRQVLRKLGVERIIVAPDGAGWTFEGSADLVDLIGARQSLVGKWSPQFSARPGVPVEQDRTVSILTP